MNRKQLDLFFIFLTILPFIFILMLYQAWNNLKPSTLPQITGNLKDYSINKCEITSRYIYVSGWASIPNTKHYDNRVYIKHNGQYIYVSGWASIIPNTKHYDNRVYIKHNGQYILLNRSVYTQSLQDIGANGFDNAGFISSKKLSRADQIINKKILIVSMGPDNQFYGAIHDC